MIDIIHPGVSNVSKSELGEMVAKVSKNHEEKQRLCTTFFPYRTGRHSLQIGEHPSWASPNVGKPVVISSPERDRAAFYVTTAPSLTSVVGWVSEPHASLGKLASPLSSATPHSIGWASILVLPQKMAREPSPPVSPLTSLHGHEHISSGPWHPGYALV